MTAIRTASLPVPDRWTWLWLGVALVLGLVGTGRWVAPVAVWLGSVFLLRFFRTQRPLRAWLAAAPAISLSFFVGWKGLIPFGGDGVFVGMAVVAGFVGGLPFLADRLLHSRFGAFARTLVLPSLVTGLEFAGQLGGDLTGSWGATAYTQAGSPTLMQLASVTGLWGITFLVTWLAPVVNHVWERGFELRRGGAPLLAYGVVVLAVVLGGQLRLALATPGDTTFVRVAAVAEPALSGPEGFWPAGRSRRYYRGDELTEDDWREIEVRMARIHDRLFERTRLEAEAGARIVFWAEANAPVRRAGEEALLARGVAFAREHDTHLGMSLVVLPDRASERLQNKVVFVTPGGVAGEYHKSIPVPGFEASVLERGDGVPAVWDTPYGRIGVVICYDLDFPRLIQRAGAAGVDILFAPANDWAEIAAMHHAMARFRAVEQGITIVRPATGGISSAIDPFGAVLASLDYHRATERGMGVSVPARKVWTAYGVIGDLVGWVSLTLAVLLVAVGAVRTRRERVAKAA
jgi:apolipoprotein N-acyltransferase